MEIAINNLFSIKKEPNTLFKNKNALLATAIAAIAAASFLALKAAFGGTFVSAAPIAFGVLCGISTLSAFYLGMVSNAKEQSSIPQLNKLLKNSKKAIDQHRAKEQHVYAPSNKVLKGPWLQNTPLNFTISKAEAIGLRRTMEDATLDKKISAGSLVGIFDGHGGAEVAKYAAKRFPGIFSKHLAHSHDPAHAFDASFLEIQKNIERMPKWNCMGSTAAICFIDKANCAFTATLGDSEVNVYRKIKGKWKSIPLSCVRDWTSPKDAKRAAIALNSPEIAEKWPKCPTKPRFPFPTQGINVSRSLGDVYLAKWPPASIQNTVQHPGVIQKAKITFNQLQKGDILIAACDGLKDFVSEKEILAKIKACENMANLANELTKFALEDKKSQDNVSVLVLEAK